MKSLKQSFTLYALVLAAVAAAGQDNATSTLGKLAGQPGDPGIAVQTVPEIGLYQMKGCIAVAAFLRRVESRRKQI